MRYLETILLLLCIAAVTGLSQTDNGVPASEAAEWREIWSPTTGSHWRTKKDDVTGEQLSYDPFTSEIWRDKKTGNAEAVAREELVWQGKSSGTGESANDGFTEAQDEGLNLLTIFDPTKGPVPATAAASSDLKAYLAAAWPKKASAPTRTPIQPAPTPTPTKPQNDLGFLDYFWRFNEQSERRLYIFNKDGTCSVWVRSIPPGEEDLMDWNPTPRDYSQGFDGNWALSKDNIISTSHMGGSPFVFVYRDGVLYRTCPHCPNGVPGSRVPASETAALKELY
jgi:hypothetical protein